MKYVAYHRTSTKDQHLDRGIAELTKYCADNAISLYKGKVYTDQQTGKNFNRPRYTMLKDEILESGDVLIVTELDRLGRNKEATLKELRFFKDNGIRVMVLELPTTLIDLSAMENSIARMMLETINNMMIELYASMAQAEIEKKEKRQREGIEQKKARGEWDDYGRPAVMSIDEFSEHYQNWNYALHIIAFFILFNLDDMDGVVFTVLHFIFCLSDLFCFQCPVQGFTKLHGSV